MISIVMLPHRGFPSDHAMLETVYTRILPSRGYHISWLMHATSAAPSSPVATWNGTTVHLLPPRSRRPKVRELPARLARPGMALNGIVGREPVDIIQVRNDLVDAISGLTIARRHGIKFVYQLSFPLGESDLVEPGLDGFARSVALARVSVALRLRRFIVRTADLVLAISETMRNGLIEEGVEPERIMVLPMGADLSATSLAHTPPSVPTMIYAGTLARSRQLDFLLDVLVCVRREIPSAQLVVVGGGEPTGEAWLREQARARGLEHAVTFTGLVPRVEVPKYLAAAHLSLSPIPPAPFFKVASPTKVVESLAVGIPVVANAEIPEQARLLEASGGGRAVPYSVDAFVRAACELLMNPAVARAAAAKGREYVLVERSYDRLADDLATAYARLLGRNS